MNIDSTSYKIHTELAPGRINFLLNTDSFFKYYMNRPRNNFIIDFARNLRNGQQGIQVNSRNQLMINMYNEFISYDNNYINSFFDKLNYIDQISYIP